MIDCRLLEDTAWLSSSGSIDNLVDWNSPVSSPIRVIIFMDAAVSSTWYGRTRFGSCLRDNMNDLWLQIKEVNFPFELRGAIDAMKHAMAWYLSAFIPVSYGRFIGWSWSMRLDADFLNIVLVPYDWRQLDEIEYYGNVVVYIRYEKVIGRQVFDSTPYECISVRLETTDLRQLDEI